MLAHVMKGLEVRSSMRCRAPRFSVLFGRPRPLWWREPCRERLAGMFGSVVSDRFARSWQVLAASA
jgi:hypothetical protein